MEYFEFTSDGDPKVSGIRNGTTQAWFEEDFWKINKELNDFIWNDDRHDLRYCPLPSKRNQKRVENWK